MAVATRDQVETAHAQAVAHDAREMAGELQELLGQKLVAFALGDRHPKSIGRYASGARDPEPQALGGLIDLYTVVLVLRSRSRGPDTWIKRWMVGTNPRLGNQAPIEVFHDGRRDRVMSAAKAFVSGR